MMVHPPPFSLACLSLLCGAAAGGAAVPRNDRRRRLEDVAWSDAEDAILGAEAEGMSGHSFRFVGCRNLDRDPTGVLVEEVEELQGEETEEEEAMEEGNGEQAGNPFTRRRRRHGRRLEQAELPKPRALVTFQFCDAGLGCGSLSCGYSEYDEMTVDMDTYLDIVLSYTLDEREDYCSRCEECYQFLVMEATGADGAGMPAICDGLDASCNDQCLKIANMEEDGYVDAAEFAECRPWTDADGPISLGARCADWGGIEIGAFVDGECKVHNPSEDVEELVRSELGRSEVRLSYDLLNGTFANDGGCVASCEDGVCEELQDAYEREFWLVQSVDADHGGHGKQHSGNYNHDDEEEETCVFQTSGGQYYAGRYCEFPATSLCLYDDDDDSAGGINAEEAPHFCTNDGICSSAYPLDDFMVDDSLDDAVLANSFYCVCPSEYYGRYCELVVAEADVEHLADDDSMAVGVSSPTYRPTAYEGEDYAVPEDHAVAERNALVGFYESTVRDGAWANQYGWLTHLVSGIAVCEWYGVKCDAAGSVTRLELRDNSIKGYFEGSYLARLGNLTWIDLSNNAMYGGISEDLGNLGRLTYLNLGRNELRGSIPSSLSRLSKLETLDLSDNYFDYFPFEEFTDAVLDSLARVDISSNMIRGTMPYRLFSSNPDLMYLNVAQNRLSGTIPGAILDTAFEKPFSHPSDGPYEYLLNLSLNLLEGRVPNLFAENLTLGVVGNRFDYIDPEACGQDWNDGATARFGCAGIACPVGTANSEGRQSTEDNPCMNCTSAMFLGTVMAEIDEDECEAVDHTGGAPFEEVYQPTPHPIPSPVSSYVEVLSPSKLVREGGYEHLPSLFGPRTFFGQLSAEANIYYADSDLCDADFDTSLGYPARDQEDGVMLPWPEPFILMVDRGRCTFAQKVWNAQKAGAFAVVIADNTCLCEMMRFCTLDPGQDCEEKWPIMADDGSGSEIFIPSFLLLKQDADLIKAEVRANNPVLMKITFPEHGRIAVDYELWMSPADAASMDFLVSFKEYAEALSGYARFFPHFFIQDGIRAGCWGEGNPCYNLCTNGGRYCSTDPDNDLDKGVSGADVVTESLRLLCIWQEEGVGGGFRARWWDYVSSISELVECEGDSFSESCVIAAMSKAGINPSNIERCIEGAGGLDDDNANELLQEQLDAKERSNSGRDLLRQWSQTYF